MVLLNIHQVGRAVFVFFILLFFVLTRINNMSPIHPSEKTRLLTEVVFLETSDEISFPA